MYDSTEHLQSTGMAPSPGRGIFLAFGARHIKGVAVSRWVAAACFVIAGALVVAFGHWWGLVFFVAAALNGSLAYLVPRWNQPRNAPDDAKRSA
jgi:membrane protein implicated in regulation of membrane protease activity